MEFLAIITTVLVVSFAVAVIFWDKILEWTEKSLLPWIKKNIPEYEKYVRKALVVLDKVSVSIIRTAKTAWKKLREKLLEATITVQKNSENKWVKQATEWIIDVLEDDKVTKVTTEEQVEWDELPDNIREALLKKKRFEVDVTQTREEEFEEKEEMAMTN